MREHKIYRKIPVKWIQTENRVNTKWRQKFKREKLKREQRTNKNDTTSFDKNFGDYPD